MITKRAEISFLNNVLQNNPKNLENNGKPRKWILNDRNATRNHRIKNKNDFNDTIRYLYNQGYIHLTKDNSENPIGGVWLTKEGLRLVEEDRKKSIYIVAIGAIVGFVLMKLYLEFY